MPKRLQRSLIGAYVLTLSLLFSAAYLGRDAVVLSTMPHDDTLFIRLGMSLAAGHWLGPYTELTHAKGMGFPAFLALSHSTGLPITLSEGLAYLGATLFLALVAARVSKAPILYPLLATLLLGLPALAAADQMRITREFFYTALSMILVALLIDLFILRSIPRILSASLAGLFGAWFWLTREEGVWLAPALVVLVVGSLLLPPPGKGRANTADALVRLTLFLAISTGLVSAVGLKNRSAYGSFVVNDFSSGPFVDAVAALQRAAYPYRRPRISVTREARLRIYAESPSFAALRPYIDLPNGVSPWGIYGCQWDPRLCGDIANGWFLWNFRMAAALSGAYSTPTRAAGFYREITKEVELACHQGRLSCASWVPPLVGPISAEQIPQMARSLGSVLRIVFMATPIDRNTVDQPSFISYDSGEKILSFLGNPQVTASSGFRPEGHTSRWRGFAEDWRKLTAAAQPLYVVFLTLGLLAFFVNIVVRVHARFASVSLIPCVALLAAVAARVIILTLIDALSFSGAQYNYGLPAIPLLVSVAAIALTDFARAGWSTASSSRHRSSSGSCEMAADAEGGREGKRHGGTAFQVTSWRLGRPFLRPVLQARAPGHADIPAQDIVGTCWSRERMMRGLAP